MSEEKADMKAWTGRYVELELTYETSEKEKLQLEIVTDQVADFDQGFLGESTPLAKAIMGQVTGTVIPYKVGDIVQVRILAVTESKRTPPADLAEKREEIIRKAVRDSDHTNAVLFASSFSGKWGDYDPDSLKESGEDDDE